MSGSFGTEATIVARLKELDCTAEFLAKLYGISNSRLSRCLRGHQDLPNDVGVQLLKLTERLIRLRDSLLPIPIAFSSVKDISWLSDHLVDDPETVRQAISMLFRQDD